MTAVRPSSIGMPAATSAPKTTMRIPSVTGSAVYSARVKSFPIVSSRASVALAAPNCSTRNSGFADWTSATAARTGFTVSVACSASSASSNWISAAWPSAETRLAPSPSSGERTLLTPSLPASAAVTSATTARKAGSDAVADSLSTKTLSSAESRKSPVVDDLLGATGLSDPELVLVELLHAHRPADDGGRDDEREPPEDRGLAVARAPAAHAGGDGVGALQGSHAGISPGSR